MRFFRYFVLPIACALAPAAAMAQSASYFDRNNNTSVLGRARPDYQALGINEGGFFIFPTLTITPEFDDNIFATSNNRTSDLITAISPAVQIASDWSRNAVNLSAQATSDIYAIHGSEDTTDYTLAGTGRLDIATASSLSATASYARNTISRTSENSPTNASQPVQFDNINASLNGTQTLNRLRFTESLGFSRNEYTNEVTPSGPISLAYLNSDIDTGNVRAEYALNPEISVYVNGQYNNRSYDVGPPEYTLNRNSSGYEITTGASFDITRLIRGQVAVGYLQQDYQSSAFHTVSGPAINANVEYFLSGLTTITVHAQRAVIDAVDPQAVSFLQTSGGLTVDHELLRNVILSARVSYETDDFTGVQRNDTRPSFSLEGTYLLNRYANIHLGYSFLDLASTGSSRVNDYNVNVISLSLVLQL